MNDYDSRLHQKRNISGVEIDDVRERYTNPVDFDTIINTCISFSSDSFVDDMRSRLSELGADKVKVAFNGSELIFA